MFERSEFCTVGIVHHLLFLFLSHLERLADRNRKENPELTEAQTSDGTGF